MPTSSCPRLRREEHPEPHGWALLVAARTDRLRVAVRRRGVVTNDYGEHRWDADALPDGPFAVYLARSGRYRTLAFDIDAKEGADPVGDAHRLAAMLDAAGVRYVEAISGPRGGRHLIATFPDGLPASLVAALAKHLAGTVIPSLDATPLCNPRTGSIRPPGAPHRAGGVSTLVTPAARARLLLAAGNPRDAFDRLCTAVGVPVGGESHPWSPARSPRPLSQRIVRLLHHGDVDGVYADRSALAAAICLAFVNAGRPYEEFQRATLDPACRGLDHLRRALVADGRYRFRSRAAITAAARRMWRGRVVYASTHPARGGSSTVAPIVGAILAAVDAQARRWGGQAGPTDRAVLHALLDRALRADRMRVHAGARDLALDAGVSRSAAARAMYRLARDGWLTRVEQAAGTRAAEYRLHTPAGAGEWHAPSAPFTMAVGGTLAPAPPTTWLRRTVTTQAHDAFTSDGLGRYAGAVLLALLNAPGTARHLARRTGLSMPTVRKHLHRLRTTGLAEPTGSLWRANDLGRLGGAATQFGGAGAVARRSDGYELERQVYAWYRADFVARRGWTVERGLYRPGRASLVGRDTRPTPPMLYPRPGPPCDCVDVMSGRLPQAVDATGVPDDSLVG